MILDAFSREVVGWAWTAMLSSRLAITALEWAIAKRQPKPGLVHHSDRGIQYACRDYVRVLQQHHMIPSMSRPANPYDNAGCESFMNTLKREEIQASGYRDLADLRTNVAALSNSTTIGAVSIRRWATDRRKNLNGMHSAAFGRKFSLQAM